jgi:hypothetical protein
MGLALPVFSQNSVLSSGKWYKMAIEKDGVYKIDAALFKKMGFDLAKTDPRKIKIYGNEGGMLPQANNVDRPEDLVENAIYVQGESDGTFSSSDYVLFYGQDAHKSYFDSNRGIFFYEKNLYADKNYYFITVGETNGKRVGTSDNLGSAFPTVNEFENFVYHELDEHNELKSGREWYGELFDLTTEVSKSFSLNNVVSGSTVKLVTDVMAKSYSGSSFNVSINGTQVIQQSILSIPNSQYGIKGRDRRDTVSVSADLLSAPTRSSQEVKYQYVKSPSGFSVGFLDYFLLQVHQKLALYGQQTIFRSSASLQNAISKFEIDQTNSQTFVWDVTNPYEPSIQTITIGSGKTSFSTSTTALREFVVFDSPLSPELIGSLSNQNIKNEATPAFIIVTHPDFKTEALRLAAHRNAVSGLSTLVCTTTEIYNEFSSGRQDVTAIRDLAKYFYDKNPNTLQALLVMGKGTYDPKKRVTDNKNFVPMYESRNSLHPLLTYSSDDYFSFLDDNEGNWGEEPVVNHLMDISVGRLPVKSIEEAKNVVDKIIRYDTDPKLRGKWNKKIVFVADDGSISDGFTKEHQSQANILAQYIEDESGTFDIQKIFMGTYQKQVSPAGEKIPQVNEEIVRLFNSGALIINYTGHGGERVLADEKIFDDVTITKLENEITPFLVTATCEFGRQDDPIFASGAELVLLQKSGGAIGLVTTSRPVNSFTNFQLNQSFYEALLTIEDGKYLSTGEIFKRTKNESVSGVSNRNFSLIGDPTLTLHLPERTIAVTEVETINGSATLMALSEVVVKGEIKDLEGSNKDVSFNGILNVVLFDKETTFTTIGKNNPPYSFEQWYNSLFRGKATVTNGEFEIHFVVPKNIAYTIDAGKLSVYAYDSVNSIEASGHSNDFQIGGSEPEPAIDTNAPTINLFIGDATFKNGGIANPNTILMAKLSDEEGINISGYGIGNSIIGTLDGDQSFILNDFYEADIDDFTKGTISFPLANLAEGKHTITVKAWDTHNNPVQGTVDFVVTDGTNLAIETFGNYPNPIESSTTLFFTHNRSGDDLQAGLTVFDNTGRVVGSYEFNLPYSTYQVNLLELTRHDRIFENRSGTIYFARLVVRSLTNGSKNEQVTKLILSN